MRRERGTITGGRPRVSGAAGQQRPGRGPHSAPQPGVSPPPLLQGWGPRPTASHPCILRLLTVTGRDGGLT